jgi:predicted O-methyltransferase YrrM
MNMPSEISGWFDFDDIYDAAVNRASSGSVFIEIGCFLGRSTAHLAKAIKSSGKSIDLHVIDSFVGESGEDNTGLRERFLSNMAEHGVGNAFRLHHGPSSSFAHLFADASVDFVFIDGDHSYEGCATDIRLYAPKVKPYGVIAGHDYYDAKGVRQAVDEAFGSDIKVSRSSWIFEKQV